MSTIENLDTITQESQDEVICDIDNIEINDETEYFDCNGSDSPKKQEETTKSIGKLLYYILLDVLFYMEFLIHFFDSLIKLWYYRFTFNLQN